MSPSPIGEPSPRHLLDRVARAAAGADREVDSLLLVEPLGHPGRNRGIEPGGESSSTGSSPCRAPRRRWRNRDWQRATPLPPMRVRECLIFSFVGAGDSWYLSCMSDAPVGRRVLAAGNGQCRGGAHRRRPADPTARRACASGSNRPAKRLKWRHVGPSNGHGCACRGHCSRCPHRMQPRSRGTSGTRFWTSSTRGLWCSDRARGGHTARRCLLALPLMPRFQPVDSRSARE